MNLGGKGVDQEMESSPDTGRDKQVSPGRNKRGESQKRANKHGR